MWSTAFKAFSKTSVWRFTFVFAAIFLLIFCVIIAVVYELTVDEQEEQLEQRLALAALGLVDLSRAQNVDKRGFVEAIQKRSKGSASLIVALKVDGGLKGNLNSIPARLPPFPETRYFPIVVTDYTGEPNVEMAIGTQVQTEFGPLVVALFDENHKALERNFATASVLALTGALFLTLVAGFLFNTYVSRRITQISALTAEVKSGRLEQRLPVSKRGDEYDRIARQINSMLDEIGELVQSVASVTDNIAHDLRTPLSRLRISIERALVQPGQDTPELSEEDRAWREGLLDELDQLLGTFNAMLELTRIEKGLPEANQSFCVLATICEDVVDLVAPLAEEKRQSLEIDIDRETSIKGDPDLLFRAIYNLVENAVKYTPEGSNIRLALSNRTLVVEDNGPGIPAEETERVFQRLHRLDKSRHSEGFGLGLSIVKAVVKLHGGSISLLDNRPGLKVAIEF